MCDCLECRISKGLGKEINQLTPEEVKQNGLGCYWCAKTGYEDFPTNQKRCRDGCTPTVAKGD